MKYLLLTAALLMGFSTSAQVSDCDVTSHHVEKLEYNYNTEEWETATEFWSVGEWEIRNEFVAFRWEGEGDFMIMWWDFSDEKEENVYRYFTEKGSLVIINAEDRYILQLLDWNEGTEQYETAYYFSKLEIFNQ